MADTAPGHDRGDHEKRFVALSSLAAAVVLTSMKLDGAGGYPRRRSHFHAVAGEPPFDQTKGPPPASGDGP
jgi:hypothetical protein